METQHGPPPAGDTAPGAFQMLESEADGLRVVALFGELDLSNVTQLKARLIGTTDTVLDLSELTFIDSSGIRLLLETAQRAHSQAWKFSVCNPQPAVLRVIKLVGIGPHLGLEGQGGQDRPVKHHGLSGTGSPATSSPHC